jgi:hypothetical protein
MASKKQVAANKANAKKSTGPKTPEGKAKSSKNALKHGVLSEMTVSEKEDEGIFNALLSKLILEHQPETETELVLVERLAGLIWRERRLLFAEKTAIDTLETTFTEILRGQEMPSFTSLSFKKQLLIGRYQTMLTNQIKSTLDQLKALQEARLGGDDEAAAA